MRIQCGWTQSKAASTDLMWPNICYSVRSEQTTFAVNELCWRMSDPSQPSFTKLKQLVQYFKGERERQWIQVFEFGNMSSEVTVVSDSDWAGDKECTHTHLLHAHFLVYIHCAYTSHILMRVTHTHGSRVSAARMSSSLCHLTFSLLTRRCSCCSLTVDFSRPRRPHWRFCPRDPAELHRPKKRRSSALRTRSRSLRLLENHEREHWTVRCFHNVRSLCFARFSW